MCKQCNYQAVSPEGLCIICDPQAHNKKRAQLYTEFNTFKDKVLAKRK